MVEYQERLDAAPLLTEQELLRRASTWVEVNSAHLRVALHMLANDGEASFSTRRLAEETIASLEELGVLRHKQRISEAAKR